MPEAAYLRDLSRQALARRLRTGIRLKQGPFTVRIRGTARILTDCLLQHYPNYPIAADTEFADATVDFRRSLSLDRDWFRTCAIRIDDGRVFTKFPTNAVLAHLEWTSNWYIAMRTQRYLMLHAGVVANSRGAVLFPGIPGAGKSTLCAYLVHHGWRLLSDEFTLIRDESLAIHPFPRLIPLKNEAIDVIQDLVPNAKIGPRIPGTRKGTVAHVCPEDWHLRAMTEPAFPKLAIFPKFERDAATSLTAVEPSESFIGLTQNAFNYVTRGIDGFRMAAALTNAVKAFRLIYSDLAQARAVIHDLMEDAA